MVETLAVLSLSALFVAIAVAIVWNVVRLRRRNSAWKQTSEKFGLTYTEAPQRKKGKAVWRKLEGVVDGTHCVVALEFSEKMGLAAVARFTIRPPLVATENASVPTDTKTGDPQFDQRFVIAAEAAVVETLRPQVRDELLEIGDRFDGIGTITSKAVSMRTATGLDSVVRLSDLVETARKIAEIIAQNRPQS